MYGEGRNLRVFLGLGAVIVLLFIVIFMIMNSGNKGKVPETRRELTSYIDDPAAMVSETIIGPVSSSQDHYEIQISVNNQSATIEVSKGYDGNVVNSKTYDLSNNGFSEFLYALDKAGFTQGNTAEDLKNDQGYCPLGQRYIFEVSDASNTIQRFWATSCKGAKTYKGNLNLTLALFKAQIPDYGAVTEGANL